jgi:hypothetical protein
MYTVVDTAGDQWGSKYISSSGPEDGAAFVEHCPGKWRQDDCVVFLTMVV